MLKFGDCIVDLESRTVTRDGDSLEIGGLTFQLLKIFAENPDRLLSPDELIDLLWPEQTVSNEALTQRIRMLRRSLGDDPTNPIYIETVRGRGYRNCAQPTTERTSQSSRPPYLLYAGAMLLIGVVVVYVLNQSNPNPELSPLLARAKHYGSLGPSEDNLRSIDLYKQYLESNPDDVNAQLSLAFQYANRVCRYDGDDELLERAQTMVNGILNEQHNHAGALAALAYTYDCQGYLNKALAGYQQAYAIDSSRLGSLASAAHLLQIKGELTEALKANLEVRDQSDQHFRYLEIQIARCLELLGFDEAAEHHYRRTVDLYPDNLFAAEALAKFFLSRGEYDAAQEVTSRAHALGGNTAHLSLLLGELALIRKDREAAIQWFDDARQKNNGSAEVYWGLLQGESQSWRDDRIARIQSAISAGDVWPENWLLMALLLWQSEQPEAAIQALFDAKKAGFLDYRYLENSPFFEGLNQTPGFKELRIAMSQSIGTERQRVLSSPWWDETLILAKR